MSVSIFKSGPFTIIYFRTVVVLTGGLSCVLVAPTLARARWPAHPPCAWRLESAQRAHIGLQLRNRIFLGNPRFPLKGCFKAATDIDIDVDVDVDVEVGCC